MRRILLLFLVAAAPVGADDLGLPLRSGDPVTILRTDHSRSEARFVGTAQDPPRLLLTTSDAYRWGGGWQEEVPLEGITRLEAKGAAEFREVRVLKGTLLGMVVGGVAAFVVSSLSETDPGYQLADDGFGGGGGSSTRIHDTVHGMQVGSLVGTLVGALSARVTGPARGWTFTPTGEAVPTEGP